MAFSDAGHELESTMTRWRAAYVQPDIDDQQQKPLSQVCGFCSSSFLALLWLLNQMSATLRPDVCDEVSVGAGSYSAAASH
jgi:hypothetical protein